jgi:RNA polymerase sigma-70 factor (ECF subfamily)
LLESHRGAIVIKHSEELPMGGSYGASTAIKACLERWRDGDASAREDLIRRSSRRLHQLASKMLRGYPSVKRWEQTDDVLQSATIRLDRALAELRPTSVADFIGLAALQIRRQLIDLARHYAGREPCADLGTSVCDSSGSGPVRERADPTSGQTTMAHWTEFHTLVRDLPVEERKVFDLHYYGGLTLIETARELSISERTAKRRWLTARLSLYRALHTADSSVRMPDCS